MKDVISGLVVAGILQFFGLIFIIAKMIPVMRNEIDNLKDDRDDSYKDFEALRAVIQTHSIHLAEERKDRENIKRELEENKQSLKEINLELKRAVDENTKAIVALETTIKMLGKQLNN